MKTPIKDMLKEFNKENYIRFFMPGHKGKTKVDIGNDITEVLDSDDLSSPTLAIMEANNLLAKAYNMPYATMVTCGSTVSVMSMLLTLNTVQIQQGKTPKVIVGRDAHKSCINAAYLFDVPCEFIKDTSTKGYIDAINKTGATAIFVTYPNYDGSCIDIGKVERAAKQKGLALIVDCAHGAHFPFSKEFPPLPKADMYCVSAHKTLGTLTQGGIVFSTDEYKQELKENLFRLHTTSPSYLIMESIDSSRAFMEENKDLIGKWIKTCEYVKENIKADVRQGGDPTRITLSIKGISGYELYDIFANSGIVGEMADMEKVVFITSIYDIDSINELLKVELPQPREERILPSLCYGKEYKAINFVKNKPTQLVTLDKAIGKTSATAIGAYPPGSALILPGEIFTKELVDYFNKILSLKGHIFGLSIEKGEKEIPMVKVIK